ncbi:Thiamine biosynthesis lipoprotein ApbE precursor [Limihaloglobus sulfuriphilus]|uniref:FAD:protein FMN transferase n=1 Tax=Limihaloglobus sulfuriphilus TaxID=1851148 RepID=A0A1Q2MCJ5_9BACT|nr:FAD:protein FMN transferase [Limihaloglobus sulfuriphilus]AQQ70426.1 Thiamine biosynthesis lipoprotein ApbE precursor [Limihaloglobus sulfuriphilus]
MKKVNPIEQAHRFASEAMNSTFEAYIIHPDKKYASQAAYEGFREIELLEKDLSRYIDNSEITQISRLCCDREMTVSPWTMECLAAAAKIFAMTEGAFDITMDKDRPVKNGPVRSESGFSRLALDIDSFKVSVSGEPVTVDLGGIGKGYALEKMAEVLIEWDITDFLIHGGRSSVLARGACGGSGGWPVRITNQLKGGVITKAKLLDSAMASSGLQKGEHIINPRTGSAVSHSLASWVIHNDAAIADGLSTAFIIMKDNDIQQLCEKESAKAIIIDCGNPNVVFAGDWRHES